MSSVEHKQTEDFSGAGDQDFSPAGGVVSVERDPEDVLTISHLLRTLFVLVALLFLSVGSNFYLALRKGFNRR